MPKTKRSDSNTTTYTKKQKTNAPTASAVANAIMTRVGPNTRGNYGYGGILRAEKKFVDVFFGAVASGGDAGHRVFQLLNGVASGNAPNQRVGQKFQMKSIQIRWQIAGNGTNIDHQRLIVVYDQQPNGTATESIIYPQLLQQSTSGTTNLLNLDNRSRFKVIFDQDITIDASHAMKAGVLYRRINYETTNNSGTTNTIASINTGAVYLLCYGQNAFANTGAVAAAQLSFESRIRYIDA